MSVLKESEDGRGFVLMKVDDLTLVLRLIDFFVFLGFDSPIVFNKRLYNLYKR